MGGLEDCRFAKGGSAIAGAEGKTEGSRLVMSPSIGRSPSKRTPKT